jgi:SdpC family antimicrobial peptide
MKLKNKISAIFLLVLILFTSCTQNYVSNPTNFSGEEYFKGIFFKTGEVAKLLPDYALTQDSYAKLSSEQIQQQDEFQKMILNKVNQDYPSFFNEFRVEIQSGDRNKIKNILNIAGEKLYYSMKKLPAFAKFFDVANMQKIKKEEVLNDKGELDQDKLKAKVDVFQDLLKETIASNGGEHGQCIYLAIVFVAYIALLLHSAVLVSFALAIAGVLAVVFAIVFPSIGGGENIEPYFKEGGSSDLRYENLINQIAELNPPSR